MNVLYHTGFWMLIFFFFLFLCLKINDQIKIHRITPTVFAYCLTSVICRFRKGYGLFCNFLCTSYVNFFWNTRCMQIHQLIYILQHILRLPNNSSSLGSNNEKLLQLIDGGFAKYVEFVDKDDHKLMLI